jgi:hypothetical protein
VTFGLALIRQVMSEPGRYFVEGSHVLFTQVRFVTPMPSPPVARLSLSQHSVGIALPSRRLARLWLKVYSRRWVDANNTPIPPPVGLEPANGSNSPSKQAATLPEGEMKPPFSLGVSRFWVHQTS